MQVRHDHGQGLKLATHVLVQLLSELGQPDGQRKQCPKKLLGQTTAAARRPSRPNRPETVLARGPCAESTWMQEGRPSHRITGHAHRGREGERGLHLRSTPSSLIEQATRSGCGHRRGPKEPSTLQHLQNATPSCGPPTQKIPWTPGPRRDPARVAATRRPEQTSSTENQCASRPESLWFQIFGPSTHRILKIRPQPNKLSLHHTQIVWRHCLCNARLRHAEASGVANTLPLRPGSSNP